MAKGTCSIEGCTRPVEARKRCARHYRQWLRSDYYVSARGFDPDGTRVCTECEERKSRDDFHPTRGKCKVCVAKLHAAYIKTPAGQVTRYRAQHGQRLRSYGSSLAEYQQMHADQNGLCAICNRPESRRDRGGKIKRLSMDHDHRTGTPRALLCNSCNATLGFAEDDPARLEAAAQYLRRWSHR